MVYNHTYLAGTFALALDADGKRHAINDVYAYLPGQDLCAWAGC